MSDANMYALTYDNLLSVFPDSLKLDSRVDAIAKATAAALVSHYVDTDLVNIYGRIDELPESLLDILADDFGVDWYIPESDIDQKRETLKNSFTVHRHLGTKSAVQLVIDSLYEKGSVEEWFEYNGTPYHYKMSIDAGARFLDMKGLSELIERIPYYVNLRSVLDRVNWKTIKKADVYFGIAVATQETYKATVALPSGGE